MNNTAAHYTPTKNDKTVLHKEDVLKIDICVHVDGYIADTAYTISFDEKNKSLIEASKNALNAVIDLCKPGIKLSKISETIEDTIKPFGFKPIANLTGHGLDRFNLHAYPQIPNIMFKSDYVLKEDQILAIEPFATDGEGVVKDSEEVFIFIFSKFKPVRNQDARKIIDFLQRYNGLPFAERWMENELGLSDFRLKIAIRELIKNGIINTYSVLVESKGSKVSQHEHTIIVRDDPIITTL